MRDGLGTPPRFLVSAGDHTDTPAGTPSPCRIPRMQPSQKPTDDELHNRFVYHPPKTKTRIDKHEEVTAVTLACARRLRDICPGGRNLSLALTAIEDARMRANAALACDSPTDD